MANQVLKEKFDGKYSGIITPTLMAKGAISDGLNVRRASPTGGWKTRKGCALHNTTALESGAAVRSIHLYQNPLQEDLSFIAQCNSKLIKATNVPTASGTTFGTELTNVAGSSLAVSSTQKGFSDQVGEWFFYADGSGRPIAYGGTSPFPHAVLNYDNSETDYLDHTRKVKDGRSDTYAIMVGAASDKLYIITEEPCTGVTFDFGTTVNAEVASLTVKAFRSGAYADASCTDGTVIVATKSFSGDGSVTWAGNANDQATYIGGYYGYSYEFSWSAALTTAIQIVSVKVTQPAARMTNKWHGTPEYPSGCRFWDNSSGEFIEALGKISNESTAQYIDMSEATTDDYLYIKTPEPACGFGIAPVSGYTNSADAQIDLIEVLEGDAWTDISTFDDRTRDSAGDSSFAQAGVISFNPSTLNPTMRTNKGDSFPGYWYRISWDAQLSADLRIYLVVYLTAPLALPAYDGCVEFKGRLALWGDPEFPNRMRISQFDKPFSFTGLDAGYSEPLGYADPILVAKKFYSELIIWKKSSIFLLEGYNMSTFGSARVTSTLGIASPKTAQVVESGYTAIHADEPKMIAIWQAVDGVYVFDGRKPRKVSGPIDQYFNPEYSTCIAAADINSLDSFVDYSNSEYHLLLPTAIGGVTELVYQWENDEWYPPWTRAIALTCGMFLRGWYAAGSSFERFYTYGGSASGFVMRLEYDTSDKNASNADVAISNYIKLRAIGIESEQGIIMKFMLRRLYVEAKAQTAGALTTTLFVDRSTTGETVSTPAALSLVNSGYSVAFPRLDFSRPQIKCFELKLALNTIDYEMELYGIVYELEVLGMVGI